MRIVFAGTPEFATHSLKALVDTSHDVVAVYTQPDRGAGRGRPVRPGPVKQLADTLGLLVEQPATFSDPKVISIFAEHNADIMVVTAYGHLIPPAVLDIPRLGCINVHASLLPRWRGAAPIQSAIGAGDPTTGVTIMQMDAGLDTGDILMQKSILIHRKDTSGSLHNRLACLGAELLTEALAKIVNGSIERLAQPEVAATYAPRLSPADALIDWRRSALELERLVRAYDPWPVARTWHAGKQLRVWASEIDTTESGGACPGRILSARRDGIVVATGDGTLRLTTLQRSGGKPLATESFLNGTSVAAGELLA